MHHHSSLSGILENFDIRFYSIHVHIFIPLISETTLHSSFFFALAWLERNLKNKCGGKTIR